MRWLPRDLYRCVIILIIIRINQVTAGERDPDRAAFDVETEFMIIVSVSKIADRERGDSCVGAVGVLDRDTVQVRQT